METEIIVGFAGVFLGASLTYLYSVRLRKQERQYRIRENISLPKVERGVISQKEGQRAQMRVEEGGLWGIM